MTDETQVERPVFTAQDQKIKEVFGDLVIDKRRLPSSQLTKRSIPAYVAEWVLDEIVPGYGPITAGEMERVQQWADRFIPVPGDSNLVKNRLINGEIVKVLTPVEVEVRLTRHVRERVAQMRLLGLSDVHIPDTLVEQHPDLLKQGMWGVVEIIATRETVAIASFKPMQASVNLELFKQSRANFTLSEWRSLLLTSMGYDPSVFGEEEKTFLLCRLLPLVEKNLHLMELAPKGTGKSYIYENISPRVRLLSGGNVSPAVLFVNNASGQWGLLARFAVVVLDEVQTLKFEKPQEIVGGLKGFLANGRLTRGGLYETASDCSVILLANILLDAQQQPIVHPLIKELPDFLQETAFLDRLRGLIPGWRVRKLSGDCFAQGIGLKADFFGDALLALREDLAANQYCATRIQLKGTKLYKRNEDAVRAIASGLLKLQFPHGEVSDGEFEMHCVRPAVRLRQLIWDQLQLLDAEYRQYESGIAYEIVPD
jgi:ATP-dependent Lon protease